MGQRKYYIPALDRIGLEAVKAALESWGYTNPDRAIEGWIKRRGVSGKAQVRLMEFARTKRIRLRVEEFQIKKVDDSLDPAA